MYIYYELCEKIWGGSPATEEIETGVDTEEVNQQQVDVCEREKDCDEDENLEVTDSSSQCYNASGESSTSEEQSSSPSHKRYREKLDETLAMHKHKRMKKRMPADAQMLGIAEKELELKQNMADKLEAMNKDHKETMMALTENLKNLSNTMSNAFSFLQQALMQRSSSNLPPYYNQYANPTPPSPTLSGSPAPAHYRSPSIPTPGDGTQTQSPNYEYSQSFLDDC